MALGLLWKEIERAQKQLQEEMVRIGLEETRRRQTVIGRRLNSEELWSIRQSYGLTDEQMRVVEERYGSVEEIRGG